MFYVAVGSSTYARSTSPRLHGFGELPEAAKSARAIAALLQQGGAHFGITLVGKEKYVCLADIEGAIGEVHAAFGEIEGASSNNSDLLRRARDLGGDCLEPVLRSRHASAG